MKPERLILSAWGPYPEETDIDFKKAGENGLFLITGPTGSGKTTLFDGISFALFGEVSGSIRENSSLRSDFAMPEMETFVRLFFVHRKKHYEIFRSPRYERQKKRGSGTVAQAEKAELFCEGELLADGAREVTEAMQALLGLNAVQFKQVSMIAQGEFQKLLIAGAKERTQIFRTIFHTRNVETTCRLVSEQAKALYASYNNLMQRIQEAAAGIEADTEEELSELCVKKGDFAQFLQVLSGWIEKEKKEYKKKDKEYTALEKETAGAALLIEQSKRRQRLLENIEALCEEQKLLQQYLEEQKKELERISKEQPEEKLASIEEALSTIQEQKEIYLNWKREQENLTAEEQELQKLQKQYLEQEQKEKESQAGYEQVFSMYRRMSAGILAKDLREGMPCPVCGSLNHPHRAQEAQTVSQEELERAKEEWDRQREKTAGLHARTAECYAQVRVHREQLEREILQLPKEETLRQEEESLLEKKAYYKKIMETAVKVRKDIEQKQLETERLHARQETLERELAECPQEQVSYSEEWLAGCREQMDRLTAEKERLNARITVNEKSLKSIQDKQGDVTELKKRYGIVSDVEQLIKGNNPKRLVWEQYVLSVYFDIMLHAANLRLAPMSDGRYEMFRVEGVGDLRSRDSLEIEVLDHYTGKKRSAKTLSGGEAFKASLSLALGMSDMIQSYAGGIEVDALFIDEGFGALDAQSLDQALNVLQGLTGKNCMIGIISHVQELKDRIEKQIVIEKTNTGSRVKG